MSDMQTIAATKGLNLERLGMLYARIALGSGFLSAVAARFGLWGDRVRAESFPQFIHYTGEVLSFLPARLIPSLAIASTIAETLLGIALITGIQLRRAAIGSAILLAMFAIAMAISFGIKSPLDESVFAASACALLLGIHHRGSERHGG